MPILISILVFTSFALLSLSLLQLKQAPAARLQRIEALTRIPSERERKLAKPLSERLVVPMLQAMRESVLSITPRSMAESVRIKLEGAGSPWGMTVADYVLLRIITLAVVPAVGFGLTFPIGATVALGAAFVLAALGWVVPEMMMQSKKKERERQIRRALPDVLDLLTVSVEAGLGFDAALAKVVERKSGPLAEEFAHLLQEIRVGKPRREALRAVSERVKIDDVSSFIASIIQADQLGVSIANILRIQAAQVRAKRRQRAEEAGMKAPIKMLFPLIFFIFPTLFVVLLGPAVIQVATTFIKF